MKTRLNEDRGVRGRRCGWFLGMPSSCGSHGISDGRSLLSHALRLPKSGSGLALLALGVFLDPSDGLANPAGLQVVSGSAQVSQTGSQLNVVASHNAFLNWNSFNIARGETTVFQQPSASSIVWNRINDPNPSQIYGSLQANGVVVLANQAGFYFGPDSFVKAAGLYVTTAPINPGMAGVGGFEFNGAPLSIPIINYGRLETADGGSLFLIAREIENKGSLSAQGGTVGLLSAQEVMISERPDGRGLSVKVNVPKGTVDNSGRIQADAGRVLMHASVVNQRGVVQANSIRERNGVIEIFASDTIGLSAGSKVAADGGLSGVSNGGSVTIKSANVFRDEVGSVVSAAGGLNGGDGGHVEISGEVMASIFSRLDATAVPGWVSGGLLIDPNDIVLARSGSGSASGGFVGANALPDTLSLNVDTAFVGFSSITLQARNNITLRSGVTWDLAASTGKDELLSKLTLQAGNDLVLEAGSRILGGQNWSVDLAAGFDFAAGTGVQTGKGRLTLSGDATIQTGRGAISALVGNSVGVGSGAIRTVGGGRVAVEAVAGNVDTGTSVNGYAFGRTGYSVNQNLGGISTAKGGSVSIKAGGNITSFLPPPSGNGVASEAGSGAFGAEAGDVTVEAGGNVVGHFVLRNGAGSILAGGDAGTSSRALALSMVDGSWSVSAARSIQLQEIRNPNGVFNSSALNNPFRFRFDYGAEASVSLKAGNGIVIAGNSLPRASGGSQGLILPPKLSLEAGAGGIQLAANITLFPSSTGNLEIKTTSGGDLRSTSAGNPRFLLLSDAERQQWILSTDFTYVDRGRNTLHLNDLTPVRIDVSGTVEDINLISSKPVAMTVGRDILNSSVQAQNFRATDQTSISAGGRIASRNYYSFVALDVSAPAPDFTVFERAAIPAEQEGVAATADSAIAALSRLFTYNPETRMLGVAGKLSASTRDLLLGIRVFNPDNFAAAPVPALFVDAATLDRLVKASEDVPLVPLEGFEINGPGKLSISARSMDLGLSRGIISHGPSQNPALIPLTPRGAEIGISLVDSFDMFSSLVLSEFGGGISLTAGQKISVGSSERLGSLDLPRGIISLGAGPISVVAGGNVEINGSRIAAYDGGNIAIKSLTGSVDAGSGGSGFVRLSKPYVDPVTGGLQFIGATIPGSGVLATTFPESIPGEIPRLGNISVETPQGDIRAGSGGFVQLDLSGKADKNSAIKLQAGTKNPDYDPAKPDAPGNRKYLYLGSIVATGSGVIGAKVDLDATGDITGLVVAQGDLKIQAQQNVSVTAIGQGAVSVKTDSGSVSGTIVGAGSVNVAGGSINATVVTGPGQANVSGSVTGTGTTQAAAPTANTASQAIARAATDPKDEPVAKQDDEEKKKDKPLLTKKRNSRVTVILPRS